MTYTACFTGHRPTKLGGYKDCPLHQNIKDWLRIQIGNLISQQYTKFISGGALGVDQWAAEQVLDIRADLIIARPFPSQACMWPATSQTHLVNLCSRAIKVVDVCPDPYAAWKMQKRNEWMVDHSQTVVAVWDGSSGGTENCVKYAEKRGIRIIRINPTIL